MQKNPPDEAAVNDEELARRILRYLRERPQVGDKLEGIAKWWMMREQASNQLTPSHEHWPN